MYPLFALMLPDWRSMHYILNYNVIAYTVVIHGRLDTRVETRCPGGVSISCLASRSRHFSYSEIEFYFQVLVKFFFIPCQEILTGLFIHQPTVSNYYLIMR